mmetsp:Transcript_4944/g.12545  ORF Transcript_4944/g.12545 Transcript_4944/m.12545 type:complete len:679 (-) Transcript_4944:1273-3309(-)
MLFVYVVLAELDGDERDVDVLTLLVLARHHDVKVPAVRGDLQLGHGLHQVAHLLVHALLVLGEDVVVDEALAARHTVRRQPLRLEPVQQLLHGEVPLQDPPVPQAPRQLLELELLGRDGLGHGEQRQREVGEGVAVRLDGRPVEHLVQLQAHQPGGHGGGGGNGGGDAACDELGLELVDLLDAVVAGAHVAEPGDGVHVEVGVVVLLERDGPQAVVPLEAGAHRLQLAQQVLDDGLVVHAHAGRRGSGLGVRLDLDPGLGLELHHGHLGDGGGELGVIGGPRRALQPVHLRLEVGHGAHQLQVRRVGVGEVQGVGEPLGRRPEGRPRGGGGVLREREDQLRDLVVEGVLEAQARPGQALLVGGAARGEQALGGLLHVLARLRVARRPRRRRVLLGLGQVRVGLPGGLLEHALKLRARPREAVVDVVREGVQRAHGRGLLRGVARRAVVLSHVRHHHLRVALGAQRAGLQQRHPEVHATGVHVQARVDVVQRVHHHVQPLPVRVVEHVLRLGRHAVLQRRDVEVGVDGLSRVGRARALGLADVPVAEQELPAQVGLLDHVVVRHGHSAVVAAAEPHEREILDKLAAQRAGTHQEHLARLQLALQRPADARNLRVVAPSLGRHLRLGEQLRLGERLHAVEVEPLVQGVELARARLHHLLPHHAAEHGRHGREVPAGGLGK